MSQAEALCNVIVCAVEMGDGKKFASISRNECALYDFVNVTTSTISHKRVC